MSLETNCDKLIEKTWSNIAPNISGRGAACYCHFQAPGENKNIASHSRHVRLGHFFIYTTRLYLILIQNVTKNRTDHRMHVEEGAQMCQINRWNNSFQNMDGMNRQQLTVWPRKLALKTLYPSLPYIF